MQRRTADPRTWIVTGTHAGGDPCVIRLVSPSADDAVRLVREHWQAFGFLTEPADCTARAAARASSREHDAVVLLDLAA